MGSRVYVFRDADWSEYVYNCLRLCSAEDKVNLSTNELFNLRSKTAMRRFADYEGLEKQFYLLSRIGFSFCWFAAPTNANMEQLLEEVQWQYEKLKNRKDVVKLMGSEKFFAVSSRQIMQLGHMAAQNSHSQVYVLDHSYLKLRDSLNESGEAMFNKVMEESKRSLGDLASFALTTLVATESVQSICGVTEFQLKILLALYQHQNNFVTQQSMAAMVGESYRGRGLVIECNRMMADNYIDKLKTATKAKSNPSAKYTIADKGIHTVLTFLKYVTKKTIG